MVSCAVQGAERRAGERKLEGMRALVTGANSGIGRAIAEAFGTEGASVGINYLTGRGEAEDVVRAIERAGGRAAAFPADISDEGQVRRMFKDLHERFGRVDILVNNAGIERDVPFAEMSLEEWRKVIDVNLTGAFLCSREAVRGFLRGGERGFGRCAGKIIFISSVHEVIPWACHVNYTASKGGMMLLMRSLAQELGGKKVRVNSISPGAIRTAINRPVWQTEEAEEELLKLIPYGRIGEPGDVAKAAVWLASEDSDYVHGTTLYVDGGMTLYPAFARGG